jgi:hypothetical protein
MADETLSAYSALYARLDSADRDADAARVRVNANPELMAAKIAAPDPQGFRKALDALIPKVQAAFDDALKAHDYDRSEKIEGFLTRLYFWRIFARDQLIAALDVDGADEAMAALGRAAAKLKETRDAFDQGDSSTAVAAEGLDELAGALGIKN